nr:integrase, catalytic region, zinc finger, CCHC-type, peptidase aspartic, catalytic [Tanacetum cinerariifolium]
MQNNIMAAGSRDRPPMLATRRYPQWRSRFLRYIDTRPNGKALRKCILSGPDKPTIVLVQAVDAVDDSLAIPEHTTVETPMNMSLENKAYFESEKEAIHLTLTGIGDEIYSTVDACQTAQETWEAIERLQQGNEIAKPITPPSETSSEKDSDPEQAQRDEDMQKNLALIAKYFKKIYKPTNNNLRTSSSSRKPKRVKDSTYHKEKMLLCKQAEQAESGIGSEPVEHVQNDVGYNVFFNDLQHFEQSESVSDTCLVETDDSNVILDSPDMCEDDIQNEQNDVESDDERVALTNLIANLKLDVDENKKIQNQLKKANTTLAHELKECKSILAETSKSLEECISVRDSCLVALQNKQIELEKYKAFNDRTIDYDKLERKLNETLGQLAQKDIEIKEGLKTKAYELSVVKEKHDELIKQSLLTKSHYEGLVKQKTKVITDLKLREEHNIDQMLSMEKQLKLLNEIVYKRSQPIQTIHIMAPKVPTYNGRPTFANPRYLKQAQFEIPCLYAFPYDQSTHANRLIPDREETLALERESRSKLNKDLTHNDSFRFVHELKQEMHVDLKYVESLEKEIDDLESDKVEFSNMYDVILQEFLGKPAPFLNSLERIYFPKTRSVPKTNVSEGLSKPVTAQTLPQTARKAVSNTNVLKPRMYQIDNRSTQTRAPQLPQTVRNTNPRVSTSKGVNYNANVSRPRRKSNQLKDKVMPHNSQVKLKKTQVEVHPRIPSVSNKIKYVTTCKDSLNSKNLNANAVCATCNKCLVDSNHFAFVTKMLNDMNARTNKPNVVPISTRKPKGHANKFFATILGYGDLVQRNVTINEVYYIEGLNHNLFSVGQFCDANLEVAFKKSTCFVRDLQGNDLLTDVHVPSQQEFDLLFGPLYDEFFNAGSNPQDKQPTTNIQSTSASSTPIYVHAEENTNDQAEEGEHLQDDEFTNLIYVKSYIIFLSKLTQIGISYLLAVAFIFRQWGVPSGSGNFLTNSGNALYILLPTILP